MKKYEIVDDITSDVMFKAYGKDLEELVENSAEALFSVVCDIEKVEEKEVLMVEAEGEDEKELIYNWLSELLTVIDTENMFFKKFRVLELDTGDKFKMRVECHGEEIRSELILTIAKAVTYYRYSVEKTKDGWVASVVLDI
ncbi:MAG: archease [Candidatus Aenigmarchaeota archaeon]|nr:archease [Candidatus Aenigmarchaeota archaeon]